MNSKFPEALSLRFALTFAEITVTNFETLPQNSNLDI